MGIDVPENREIWTLKKEQNLMVCVTLLILPMLWIIYRKYRNYEKNSFSQIFHNQKLITIKYVVSY